MKKFLVLFALLCVSIVQFQSTKIARPEKPASMFTCYGYPVVGILGSDCAYAGESLYYYIQIDCPGVTPYTITWGASNGDTGSGLSFTTTMPASGPLNVWVVLLDSQNQGAYKDKYTNQNSDCGGGTGTQN